MVNDHDKVIRLEASQESLCIKMDRIESKIDKFITVADSKLSWKPLFALIGTAVIIIGIQHFGIVVI